jgi:hypothetical protein
MHQLRTFRLSSGAMPPCNGAMPAKSRRRRHRALEATMTRNPAMTIRTVDLGYDQLLVLQDRPGARVRVLHGGVWLTEEGRPEDVFAHDGQMVALRSGRRALLEALGPTRLEVEEPLRARPFRALAARGMLGARAVLRSVRNLGRWTMATSRATLATAGLIIGVAVPTLVVVGMTEGAVTPLLQV